VKKTKKRTRGGSRRPRHPGGPAVGDKEREATRDRVVLMTLARMAVLDDGLCAGDVIEVLKEFGLASVVSEARRMK
jgi:hypothetical protein